VIGANKVVLSINFCLMSLPGGAGALHSPHNVIARIDWVTEINLSIHMNSQYSKAHILDVPRCAGCNFFCDFIIQGDRSLQ
jgi:hypothetical protein